MKGSTMKSLTIAAFLLASASPLLADNDRPRGWLGAYEVYSCHPEEWFLNEQDIWQNPTCVNISGGGNPAPVVALPPPDEDDEVDPPDEEEEEDDEDPVDPPDEDDEDPPEDDCACDPDWNGDEEVAQV
ncbi:MAG: hypothetical protein HC888_01555 [Candidatus Competibacteraceae bacterium]|nr:hypothetical protein [Candidatus Competibacteraceae bacterium]